MYTTIQICQITLLCMDVNIRTVIFPLRVQGSKVAWLWGSISKAPIDMPVSSLQHRQQLLLHFVIGLLVGYMIYGAALHIVKVEDDSDLIQKVKVLAEVANTAKIPGMLALLLCHRFELDTKGLWANSPGVWRFTDNFDHVMGRGWKILEAVSLVLRSILDDVLSLFSEKSRHKGV